MSTRSYQFDDVTRSLVVAIIDFLRDQLETRTDFLPEDRDGLEITIQCLEMAYEIDAGSFSRFRSPRPLLDVFNQVTHPVPVKDKLTAEYHKDNGNIFMRQNMPQEAEAEYTRAIELDQWNAIYYCNRASARMDQQLYFEGISDCRQALLLNPDYAKAYARMGQAYAMIHRPREAARCFSRAVELEPDNERYRNNLRVAESQIQRSGATGILETLLGSFFGLESQQGPSSTNLGLRMPSSFMIITESHPATQRPAQNDNEQGEESETSISRSSSEGRRIHYHPPYGVVNEGAHEKSVTRSGSLSDNNDALYSFMEIPTSEKDEKSQGEMEESLETVEGEEECNKSTKYKVDRPLPISKTKKPIRLSIDESEQQAVLKNKKEYTKAPLSSIRESMRKSVDEEKSFSDRSFNRSKETVQIPAKRSGDLTNSKMSSYKKRVESTETPKDKNKFDSTKIISNHLQKDGRDRSEKVIPATDSNTRKEKTGISKKGTITVKGTKSKENQIFSTSHREGDEETTILQSADTDKQETDEKYKYFDDTNTESYISDTSEKMNSREYAGYGVDEKDVGIIRNRKDFKSVPDDDEYVSYPYTAAQGKKAGRRKYATTVEKNGDRRIDNAKVSISDQKISSDKIERKDQTRGVEAGRKVDKRIYDTKDANARHQTSGEKSIHYEDIGGALEKNSVKTDRISKTHGSAEGGKIYRKSYDSKADQAGNETTGEQSTYYGEEDILVDSKGTIKNFNLDENGKKQELLVKEKGEGRSNDGKYVKKTRQTSDEQTMHYEEDDSAMDSIRESNNAKVNQTRKNDGTTVKKKDDRIIRDSKTADIDYPTSSAMESDKINKSLKTEKQKKYGKRIYDTKFVDSRDQASDQEYTFYEDIYSDEDTRRKMKNDKVEKFSKKRASADEKKDGRKIYHSKDAQAGHKTSDEQSMYFEKADTAVDSKGESKNIKRHSKRINDINYDKTRQKSLSEESMYFEYGSNKEGTSEVKKKVKKENSNKSDSALVERSENREFQVAKDDETAHQTSGEQSMYFEKADTAVNSQGKKKQVNADQIRKNDGITIKKKDNRNIRDSKNADIGYQTSAMKSDKNGKSLEIEEEKKYGKRIYDTKDVDSRDQGSDHEYVFYEDIYSDEDSRRKKKKYKVKKFSKKHGSAQEHETDDEKKDDRNIREAKGTEIYPQISAKESMNYEEDARKVDTQEKSNDFKVERIEKGDKTAVNEYEQRKMREYKDAEIGRQTPGSKSMHYEEKDSAVNSQRKNKNVKGEQINKHISAIEEEDDNKRTKDSKRYITEVTKGDSDKSHNIKNAGAPDKPSTKQSMYYTKNDSSKGTVGNNKENKAEQIQNEKWTAVEKTDKEKNQKLKDAYTENKAKGGKSMYYTHSNGSEKNKGMSKKGEAGSISKKEYTNEKISDNTISDHKISDQEIQQSGEKYMHYKNNGSTKDFQKKNEQDRIRFVKEHDLESETKNAESGVEENAENIDYVNAESQGGEVKTESGFHIDGGAGAETKYDKIKRKAKNVKNTDTDSKDGESRDLNRSSSDAKSVVGYNTPALEKTTRDGMESTTDEESTAVDKAGGIFNFDKAVENIAHSVKKVVDNQEKESNEESKEDKGGELNQSSSAAKSGVGYDISTLKKAIREEMESTTEESDISVGTDKAGVFFNTRAAAENIAHNIKKVVDNQEKDSNEDNKDDESRELNQSSSAATSGVGYVIYALEKAIREEMASITEEESEAADKAGKFFNNGAAAENVSHNVKKVVDNQENDSSEDSKDYEGRELNQPSSPEKTGAGYVIYALEKAIREEMERTTEEESAVTDKAGGFFNIRAAAENIAHNVKKVVDNQEKDSSEDSEDYEGRELNQSSNVAKIRVGYDTSALEKAIREEMESTSEEESAVTDKTGGFFNIRAAAENIAHKVKKVVDYQEKDSRKDSKDYESRELNQSSSAAKSGVGYDIYALEKAIREEMESTTEEESASADKAGGFFNIGEAAIRIAHNVKKVVDNQEKDSSKDSKDYKSRELNESSSAAKSGVGYDIYALEKAIREEMESTTEEDSAVTDKAGVFSDIRAAAENIADNVKKVVDYQEKDSSQDSKDDESRELNQSSSAARSGVGYDIYALEKAIREEMESTTEEESAAADKAGGFFNIGAAAEKIAHNVKKVVDNQEKDSSKGSKDYKSRELNESSSAAKRGVGYDIYALEKAIRKEMESTTGEESASADKTGGFFNIGAAAENIAHNVTKVVDSQEADSNKDSKDYESRDLNQSSSAARSGVGYDTSAFEKATREEMKSTTEEESAAADKTGGFFNIGAGAESIAHNITKVVDNQETDSSKNSKDYESRELNQSSNVAKSKSRVGYGASALEKAVREEMESTTEEESAAADKDGGFFNIGAVAENIAHNVKKVVDNQEKDSNKDSKDDEGRELNQFSSAAKSGVRYDTSTLENAIKKEMESTTGEESASDDKTGGFFSIGAAAENIAHNVTKVVDNQEIDSSKNSKDYESRDLNQSSNAAKSGVGYDTSAFEKATREEMERTTEEESEADDETGGYFNIGAAAENIAHNVTKVVDNQENDSSDDEEK